MVQEIITSLVDEEKKAKRERFHVGLSQLRAHNKALAKLQVEDRIAKRNKDEYRKAEITAALRLMRFAKGLPLVYRPVYKCRDPKCGRVIESHDVREIHNPPPEGALRNHAANKFQEMAQSFRLYEFLGSGQP